MRRMLRSASVAQQAAARTCGEMGITFVPSNRRSPSTRPVCTAFAQPSSRPSKRGAVVVHDEVDDVGPEAAQHRVGDHAATDSRRRPAAPAARIVASASTVKPMRLGSTTNVWSPACAWIGDDSSCALRRSIAARGLGVVLARRRGYRRSCTPGSTAPEYQTCSTTEREDDERGEPDDDAAGDQEHPSAARANERCCLRHRRQASEAGRMVGCARNYAFGSSSSARRRRHRTGRGARVGFRCSRSIAC